MSMEYVTKEAQRRLKADPFDAGHDLDHYKFIVRNCMNIVKRENLDVEMDALLRAA